MFNRPNPKLQVSSSIKDSRLVRALNQNNYSIIDNLVSDIHVRSCDKHLIFLPVSYHLQNPRYLQARLKKMKVLNTDKIIVLCLSENLQENSKVAPIQMQCLQFDVNLMVCFQIEECKTFLFELAFK